MSNFINLSNVIEYRRLSNNNNINNNNNSVFLHQLVGLFIFLCICFSALVLPAKFFSSNRLCLLFTVNVCMKHVQCCFIFCLFVLARCSLSAVSSESLC